MAFTVTLQWWMALAVINAGVWAWALFTPAEPSGFFPDPAPALRIVAALILTIAFWGGWSIARL